LERSLPYLEVLDPEGKSQQLVVLTNTRTTIGRFEPPVNDIALLPDPQRYVTREVHCYIERSGTQGTKWYVVSNGKNPTFIDQGSGIGPVRGKALLEDGDTIAIQAGLTDAGERFYWKLKFHDPEETVLGYETSRLEYDDNNGRLFKMLGKDRKRIKLSPREDKLISYMFARNQENHQIPTLITLSDLMQAVWEEEAPSHTPTELHKLIKMLRQNLEDNPEHPLFLLNERGRGYILDPSPIPEEEM
jgi:DNA-binding winged helix-turn-helix (wHTH) protein